MTVNASQYLRFKSNRAQSAILNAAHLVPALNDTESRLICPQWIQIQFSEFSEFMSGEVVSEEPDLVPGSSQTGTQGELELIVIFIFLPILTSELLVRITFIF